MGLPVGSNALSCGGTENPHNSARPWSDALDRPTEIPGPLLRAPLASNTPEQLNRRHKYYTMRPLSKRYSARPWSSALEQPIKTLSPLSKAPLASTTPKQLNKCQDYCTMRLSSKHNNTRTRPWSCVVLRPEDMPSPLLNSSLAPDTPEQLNKCSKYHTMRYLSKHNSILLHEMKSQEDKLDGVHNKEGKAKDGPSSLSLKTRIKQFTEVRRKFLNFLEVDPTQKIVNAILKEWEGKDLGHLLSKDGLRIVIMGPAECGKTALVNQFLEGSFLEKYYPTTENRQKQIIRLRSHSCTLELIDTSGLNRRRHDHYHEIAHGFLLVFNVTNPDSFKAMQDIRKNIELARGHNRTPLLIVGTHGDDEMDATEAQTALKLQKYQRLVKEWNCDFIDVSNRSRRSANVFYILTRLIIKHYLEVLASGKEMYYPNAPGYNPNASVRASAKSPSVVASASPTTLIGDTISRSSEKNSLCNQRGLYSKKLVNKSSHQSNQEINSIIECETERARRRLSTPTFVFSSSSDLFTAAASVSSYSGSPAASVAPT
eukprot:Ihof_evm7s159 gene=Ihof_evmTU7s159